MAITLTEALSTARKSKKFKAVEQDVLTSRTDLQPEQLRTLFCEIAHYAMNDLGALTDDDRKLIHDYIALKKNKDFMLRVRLTDTEIEYLREMAERENLSVSEYARNKIFG